MVDENLTTGYVWLINQASNDSPFKVVSDKFVPESISNDESPIGAGGNRVIELQGMQVGLGQF